MTEYSEFVFLVFMLRTKCVASTKSHSQNLVLCYVHKLLNRKGIFNDVKFVCCPHFTENNVYYKHIYTIAYDNLIIRRENDMHMQVLKRERDCLVRDVFYITCYTYCLFTILQYYYTATAAATTTNTTTHNNK